MPIRRFILLFVLFFAFGQQLQAQIKVDMRIGRRLYITYEPVIVTVAVTNLSGHDVTLQDADTQKWFSFQITTGDDRIIPPMDLNYQLTPLRIGAGETVKRTVNLASLYAVQEFGLYHLKASIYLSEMQKYFSSPMTSFEITDGKLVWQQTVGVPAGEQGAGSYRSISLLTHRREKENMLYVRVEDKDAGIVYVTSPIGRVLFSYDPQVELDRANQLHVLQLVGAKTYLYTKIGLNGEWIGQVTYNAVTSRPVLKKRPDGSVAVVGGLLDVPVSPSPGAPGVPKLSDRPPGLPKQ